MAGLLDGGVAAVTGGGSGIGQCSAVAFTALYDADVLHPPGVRDLLIRLGHTGFFRARWTEQILDEMVAT